MSGWCGVTEAEGCYIGTVGINKKLAKSWLDSVAMQCWFRQGSVEVQCAERHSSLKVRFGAGPVLCSMLISSQLQEAKSA